MEYDAGHREGKGLTELTLKAIVAPAGDRARQKLKTAARTSFPRLARRIFQTRDAETERGEKAIVGNIPTRSRRGAPVFLEK